MKAGRKIGKKYRDWPKATFSCFALTAFLLLTACARNAEAPTEPIQSTAQIASTATIEAPTQEPTEIPTAQPTLSPAERNYEWTAEEAVTVMLDATEEEIQQVLEEEVGEFFASYGGEIGAYGETMLLESISYLKEDAYIWFGEWAITVTGKASYLSQNREKTSITLALVIRDTVNRTEWLPPNWIAPFLTGPNFIQPSFAEHTTAGGGEIKPGIIIPVVFDLPNPNNQLIVGASHHAELISDLYTREMIDRYAASGDPAELNGLLVPFTVQRSQQNQPFADRAPVQP